MTWILYDIETGTIINHGDSEPTGYSSDKDVAQVNYVFWDAQPDFLYRYNGLNVEANTENNIHNYINEFNQEVIEINQSSINIDPSFSRKIVCITNVGNVDVLLSPLETFKEGDQITFLRKNVYSKYLRIIPFSSEKLDDLNPLFFYDKGSITIQKINDSWYVINRSNFFEWKNAGMSTEVDFFNETSVTINHNRGYIPRVEAWVYDDEGDLLSSECQVVHDWNSKNEFTVIFNTLKNGKILYF